MSRSRKKTPISGITTARSEKQDKRLANRRIRRRVRVALSMRPESDVLPARRELSSPWTMSKDGKKWFDPARHPKVLRK